MDNAPESARGLLLWVLEETYVLRVDTRRCVGREGERGRVREYRRVI